MPVTSAYKKNGTIVLVLDRSTPLTRVAVLQDATENHFDAMVGVIIPTTGAAPELHMRGASDENLGEDEMPDKVQSWLSAFESGYLYRRKGDA